MDAGGPRGFDALPGTQAARIGAPAALARRKSLSVGALSDRLLGELQQRRAALDRAGRRRCGMDCALRLVQPPDKDGIRRPSDYHKVLLKRMKALEARLHEELGGFEARAFVDTGPVVERALAEAAGLGWTGKNTCLIHPRLGSFGFLAVLLTSLETEEKCRWRCSRTAAEAAGAAWRPARPAR